MKFEYYTLYRSPGPGCQPMDGLVDVVDFNGRIRTEDGVTAWGKVVYDRPLTDAEIRDNELAKVK
jgi:hypothetical protein